ncbi:MAG: hypothetical protein CYPHOPRED_004081 [Cyphobasidiales sp. Tagirdzhanova-0007]|nr:MAG: hypothetical protein CYPHOPRED_004081 [Cyphobasidiales sp. Tagirdzhanova-0007]
MRSPPRAPYLILGAAALYCAGAASASQSPVSGLSGINLAGLDFGSDVWANAPSTPHSYSVPPMDQIAHFASQGVNVIRLPFLWQYMEPQGPGSGLDPTYFGLYDSYVQNALSKGVHVIIDPHNYGRWDNQIIGQSSVTNEQFNSLWDEPHDLDQWPWQTTLQSAVTAIRGLGANTQTILLPGINYTAASAFQSTNWAFLSDITDPAGGTDLLLFDLHIYFDANSAGVSPNCQTNHISDVLQPVANFLVEKGRKGFVSELGGGSTGSCEPILGQALGFIKSNPDAYAGFTVWAAGGFAPSYALSLVPNGDQDQPIWNSAVKPNLYSPNAQKAKRLERHTRTTHLKH